MRRNQTPENGHLLRSTSIHPQRRRAHNSSHNPAKPHNQTNDIPLGRALDNRLDASKRSVDRSTHGDDLAALLAVAECCPDPEDFPDWLAKSMRGLIISCVERRCFPALVRCAHGPLGPRVRSLSQLAVRISEQSAHALSLNPPMGG